MMKRFFLGLYVVSLLFLLSPAFGSEGLNTGFSESLAERKDRVIDSLLVEMLSDIDHLEDFTEILIGLEEKSDAHNFEFGQIIPTLSQNLNNLRGYSDHITEIKNFSDLTSSRNRSYFLEKLNAFLLLRLEFLADRKEKLRLKSCVNELGSKRYCYCWTTDPDRQDELNQYERLFTLITVDAYQTFNRNIVGLLSLVDLKTLPPKTKKLIRISKTLWPYIENSVDDFGHPDEAISTDVLTDIRDTDYFEKFQRHTDSNKFLHDSELPTPHFFVSPPLPSSAMAVKGNWLDEPTEKIDAKLSAKKARKPRRTLSCARADKPAALDESLQTVGANIDQSELKESEERTNSISPNSEIPVCLKAYILARAELGFSSKPYGSDVEVIEATSGVLRGSLLATYNDIFDKETLRAVSFAQFQTLWEALGGKISGEKSGGSHRSLKFRRNTIGSTYIPHNGHNYGYRCIEQLRSALKKLIEISGIVVP